MGGHETETVGPAAPEGRQRGAQSDAAPPTKGDGRGPTAIPPFARPLTATDDAAATRNEGSIAASASTLIGQETRTAPGRAESPDQAGVEVLGAAPPVPLGDAIASEGLGTLLCAGLVWFVAIAEFVVLAVLGPNLAARFHLGDHFATYVVMAPALLFAVAQPIGNLVDRPTVARPKLLGWLLALSSAALLVAGVAGDRWVFFVACALSGVGLLASQPGFIALLSDRYSTASRASVLGAYSAIGCAAFLVAPLVLLAVNKADLDGTSAWRVVFITTAAAVAALAFTSARLTDPKRGRNEVAELFGDDSDLVATQAQFRHVLVRFAQIRTIRLMSLAVVGAGFALLGWSLYFNQIAADRFGSSGTTRAVALSVAALPALALSPVTNRCIRQLFHRDPANALWVGAAGLLMFNAVIFGLWAPTLPVLVLCQAIAFVGVFAAVPAFQVVALAVIPPQMRGQAGAAFANSLFLGATAGATTVLNFAGTYGLRRTLAVLVPVVTVVAAAMLRDAARSVVSDMGRVVEELREDRAVADAQRAGQELPLLQATGINFSYGQVQILFDVDLQIAQGETVALLGTNGAGKSTLLRVLSGLEVPDRGVVRFDGHAITYAEPSVRVGKGIVQLNGGRSVFAPLSVIDNLRLGAYLCDKSDVDERVAEVLDLFPTLEHRRQQAAGTLSGGQQQMLGLAKALVLRPRLLIIDELSLGLAPVIVGELLRIVQQLKEQGTTMIIVEQSVNVALSIADRAIFMEKGEVRFEGPASELLERDDLLRAVFLGSEGG